MPAPDPEYDPDGVEQHQEDVLQSPNNAFLEDQNTPMDQNAIAQGNGLD